MRYDVHTYLKHTKDVPVLEADVGRRGPGDIDGGKLALVVGLIIYCL